MFVETKTKLFNIFSIMLCVILYCPFLKMVHIFGVIGTSFVFLCLAFFIKNLAQFKMLLSLLFIISLAKGVSIFIDMDYPLNAAVVLVPILLYYAIVWRELLKQFFCKTPKGSWGKLLTFYTLVSIVGLVIWSRLSNNVTSELNMGEMGLTNLILIGAAFSIANALYEEFLFRGCMITALLRTNNSTTALIVPSVAFAAMHYSAGFPNGMSGLMLTFIYGILMGHLFIKTCSLWPSILAHFLCDVSVFVILLMEAQNG